MKQPRVIHRLSGLLLASLLLFTAVWSPGGLAHRQATATKAKTITQHAAKSGKAHDAYQDEAKLSAAGFEAVAAPAVSIDGGNQTIFLLPAPTLLILLLLSVPLLRRFTLPHYYFSYFRHVFGHAIAPNAP